MTRAVAVAAALVVCAWFGLGAVQASSESRARERVAGPAVPSPADARRTADLIDRAGFLNPDAGVDVMRARLHLQTGDRAAARRVLLDVARREPDNVDAWTAIALAFPGDAALGGRAERELRRLSPPVPAP